MEPHVALQIAATVVKLMASEPEIQKQANLTAKAISVIGDDRDFELDSFQGDI